MAKARVRPPMGNALREARLDLRLSQEELGAKLLVCRATVTAWECGKTVPPMEQRQHVLEAIRGGPPATYERLARAFGFHPVSPASSTSTPRDAATVRAAMTNAVRAAADDLDVAPSVVRRTLAAVLRRTKELGVAPEAMESALVVEKTRG